MMNISTRGRYGIRACMELAANFGGRAMQVSQIARVQGIPEKYLAQIIHHLRKAGLVRSVRGARGGYTLARPPAEVGLDEIMEALEGTFNPVECVEKPETCARVPSCGARVFWCRLRDSVRGALSSMTLKDLVQAESEGRSGESGTYQI